MPIEENAAAGSASANTSWPQDGVTPWAVSDLGDILMDKSIDEVQKNDFVPVSKNDVASLGDNEEEDNDPFAQQPTTASSVEIPVVENHATAEDLQNIMLETPPTSSPFSKEEVVDQEAAAETVVEETSAEASAADALDLGDISLDAPAVPTAEIPVESQPAVVEEATVEPIQEAVVEEAPVAEVELDNIDLGSDMTAAEPATVEPVAEVIAEEVPATDGGLDSLGTIDLGTPEAAATDETQPTVEPVAEVAAVESAAPVESNELNIDMDALTPAPVEPVVDEVAVEPEPPVEQAAEVAPIEPTAPIAEEVIADPTVTTQSAEMPVSVESVAEPLAPTNAPQNPELDKIAEEITQGIDLDSLVADGTPPPAAPATAAQEGVPSVDQTPAEGMKAMIGWAGKSQKKALLLLGVVAILGLIYFAYQLLAWDTTTPPPAPTQTIPTEELTGDTIDDGTLSGEVLSGDMIWSGEEIGMTTGDIITEPTTGDVTASTWDTASDPIQDKEELIAAAKELAAAVRKTLIKATVQKNGPARLQAFSLQKDVDTFIQTLENTEDMTNLSDSEKQLETFSQRLVSIQNRLDGSNQ